MKADSKLKKQTVPPMMNGRYWRAKGIFLDPKKDWLSRKGMVVG